ncbi:MAG: hypothetical protein WC369_10275 [Dehalococcoidales bacterium]|jgi:hypothetical protein
MTPKRELRTDAVFEDDGVKGIGLVGTLTAAERFFATWDFAG